MSGEGVRESYDVVVIGGGAVGSIVAGDLAESGLSVLIIDRGPSARPLDTCSLTPVAGDVLGSLGLHDEMERRGFLRKTGTRITGPRNSIWVPASRPAWHARGDAFDAMLLENATALGARHLEAAATGVVTEGARIVGVTFRSDADLIGGRAVRAEFVVDASGSQAFLSRQGMAGARQLDAFSRQVTIRATFDRVQTQPHTSIYYDEPLHYSWVVPIAEDRVTLGVSVPVSTYRRLGQSPDDVMAWAMGSLHRDLTQMMVGAQCAQPPTVAHTYSYRIEPFVGEGWLCAGAAHRMADGMLLLRSSLALTEARAAAEAVREALEGNAQSALARYAELCDRGHDTAYDLISYFWRFPSFFDRLPMKELGERFLDLLAGEGLHETEAEVFERVRGQDGDAKIISERASSRTREIARLVRTRFQRADGVSAAYLEVTEDGACVSLVLDEGFDIEDSLHDFEQSLYRDFGRESLVVMRWSGEPRSALAPPSFAGAEVIFDGRST